MRIVLIGSGNVAAVLGRKLFSAGHTISQVFSRNPAHAQSLASELDAAAVSQVPHILTGEEMYIFAISDDELGRLDEWNFFTTGIVFHTAGSISREVLRKISGNYGILYPLQTLRKEIAIINEIPFLIDGNTEAVTRQIADLASSISTHVQRAGDEERKKLHLAAVMANNFSNHLFALTESFCKKEGVDFKLLYPLILEGVLRMKDHSPAELQTGPAVRGDQQTLLKHRAMLHQYPKLLKVYDLLSKSISDRGERARRK